MVLAALVVPVVVAAQTVVPLKQAVLAQPIKVATAATGSSLVWGKARQVAAVAVKAQSAQTELMAPAERVALAVPQVTAEQRSLTLEAVAAELERLAAQPDRAEEEPVEQVQEQEQQEPQTPAAVAAAAVTQAQVFNRPEALEVQAS